MAVIEDCNFPDDLHYDAENLMWVTFEDVGTIKCGLSDVGQFIAGNLLYVTPRKLGYKAKKGKRVAANYSIALGVYFVFRAGLQIYYFGISGIDILQAAASLGYAAIYLFPLTSMREFSEE